MIWWCIRYHLLTRCCFDAILLIHNVLKNSHFCYDWPKWKEFTENWTYIESKLSWSRKINRSIFFTICMPIPRIESFFFWWPASRANNRIHLKTADIKAVHFSPCNRLHRTWALSTTAPAAAAAAADFRLNMY